VARLSCDGGQTIDRQKAHYQVRSSSAYKWVSASDRLLDSGLRLHAEREDKHWSLTDCVSFVIMREDGLTRALAHDQNFEQAGFEALLRRDP
jgi:predicted nucleic acid-binding protein